MRVKEHNPKIRNTKSKKEVEEIIAKRRKEDEKMIKGHFEFIEAEGGFFEFTYKIYPGDPIRTVQIIHGEICELPLGIMKILNNSRQKVSRYKNVEQATSGPIRPPRTIETKSRMKFIPVEYL